MIMQRLIVFSSAAAFVVVAFSLALLAGASAVYAGAAENADAQFASIH